MSKELGSLTAVDSARRPLMATTTTRTGALNDSDGLADEDSSLTLAGGEGEASISEAGRWARIKQWCRTYLQYLGPGSMVAVGYMDPGNWATDIAAGSAFGYELLMVVLLSSATAVFVQRLALRLGVVTGRDLAQQCAAYFSKPVVWMLFVLAQVAIIATDMAEVIGSAIALKLLFGLDLVWGVLITAAAVLIILISTSRAMHVLEYGILALVLTIFACFMYLLSVSGVDVGAFFFGFLPKGVLATDVNALYLAIGIIGATVMPHNLYLHSGIARDHAAGHDRDQALHFSTIDILVSLSFAFVINASILTVAAANFWAAGQYEVDSIEAAFDLLVDIVGIAVANVFAVSLLMSGQSSTITGTVAGQIVAEGFINWRLTPWIRALITRLLAITPALVVAIVVGDDGVDDLLVLSQVILSFQLPFAVYPLVYFTSDPKLMGDYASGRVVRAIGYSIATVLAGLNVFLLVQIFIDVANGGGA